MNTATQIDFSMIDFYKGLKKDWAVQIQTQTTTTQRQPAPHLHILSK